MSGEAATRDGYGNALIKLGGSDSNVVVLDAGVSDSTRTNKFAEKWPERFFNMGISEGDMICTAAGMAKCGKTAFATSFISFLLGRGMDQIFVSVAYSNSNVKIIGTHAGVAIGEDGPTAQAIGDVAYMRAVPGFIVLCPADAVEAEKAILEIAKMKGPAYVRLGRGNVKTIYDDSYRFEIGKASVVAEGNDAAIIASGIMVQESMTSAELLKKDGINTRVVNMATIKPIDREAIIAAAKTGTIITAEDHNINGGLGSAVAEVIAEEKLCVKFEMVGVKDRFAESDSQKVLFRKYGLDAEAIAAAVRKAIVTRK
ncbi:transketolase family protein [Candidatus Woesearchaeota archaeon]|nr:transketolase family protein [Candidatus Woesearchaeota archaeon]